MKKGWKYYLGLVLFGYSFLPLGVVGVLPFLGMSLAESGAFAAVFLATGEIAFLTAAALLGKEFLMALKARILGLFKRTHVPKPVGRTRHRIGVLLFFLSGIPYYLVLVDLLFFARNKEDIAFLAWTLVSSEALFILSLFILGGAFWDRLNHMFDWPGDEAAQALAPSKDHQGG